MFNQYDNLHVSQMGHSEPAVSIILCPMVVRAAFKESYTSVWFTVIEY
jgi:hypothetical protein